MIIGYARVSTTQTPACMGDTKDITRLLRDAYELKAGKPSLLNSSVPAMERGRRVF
jgi:hypothetical protein